MTTPKILPLNLYESKAVLLTASPPILNQNWSFESGVFPWTVNNGGSISQSNLWAFQGSSSMLLVPNGIGANPTMFSELFPIQPNTPYISSAEFYTPQGYNQVLVRTAWYDATQTFISAIDSGVQNVPANVPAGTLISISGTSPANARFMQIVTQAAGIAPATLQLFSDLVQANPGSTPSNGLGSGVAQLTPFGARNGGLSWTPVQAQVRVDTNSLEAQCILYVSYGIQAYGLPDIVGVTESGSTGATAAMAGQTLRPGDWVTAAWSGGDPGSYAHLLLTGSIQTPGG